MNRKQQMGITPVVKPVSIKKQIKKPVASLSKNGIVNKIRIKRIPFFKIKKAQRQNNDFLFSPDAMQRSQSQLFMSLMYIKPEDDYNKHALNTVFNNQCNSELSQIEQTWNLQKCYSRDHSSKDNTLPYSQDEEQMDDMLFSESETSDIFQPSSSLFAIEEVNVPQIQEDDASLIRCQVGQTSGKNRHQYFEGDFNISDMQQQSQMQKRRTQCTEEESLDDLLLDNQQTNDQQVTSNQCLDQLEHDNVGRCRSLFSKVFTLNDLKDALPDINDGYQHQLSADIEQIQSQF